MLAISTYALARVAAVLTVIAAPSARAEGSWTPLHEAAKNNDEPAVIAALVAGGAASGACDKHGNTALHTAAFKNPDLPWSGR